MTFIEKCSFWLRPAHWGLSGGQTYDQAVLDFSHRKDKNSVAHRKDQNDLNYKYNLITEHQYLEIKNELHYQDADITFYEYKLAQLDLDYKDKSSIEYRLDVNDLDLSEHIITAQEHEKNEHDIKSLPYIKIVTGGRDVNDNIFVEFDWNDLFIAECKENGIGTKGMADEEVVEAWWQRWCLELTIEDSFDDLNQEIARRNSQTVEYHDNNNKRIFK